MYATPFYALFVLTKTVKGDVHQLGYTGYINSSFCFHLQACAYKELSKTID